MASVISGRLWAAFGVLSAVAFLLLLALFQDVTIRAIHVAFPCAVLLGYGGAWVAGRWMGPAEERDGILEDVSNLAYLLVAMAVLSEALRRWAPSIPIVLRYVLGVGLPLVLRSISARRAANG